MQTHSYHFLIKDADWDFGPQVGTQKVICYHQHIDGNGNVVPVGDPNGSWVPFIPGPAIRGNVDDIVHVRIENQIPIGSTDFVDSLKTSAIVHWHGVELANAHDGTPVTQRPIPTGESFVYKFKLHRPGVFWYHPHFNGLIQEHLGSYGPIIVEDTATSTLRGTGPTDRVIPHQDRTFFLCLSDAAFQSGAASDPPSPFTQLTNLGTPGQKFIRDLTHVGNNLTDANGNPMFAGEQFGDVHLVNGHHGAAFNTAAGNPQQLTNNTQATGTALLDVKPGEGLCFHVLNTGLARFYKIELVHQTTNSGGNWIASEQLFQIGGQGGLLHQARGGGGDFDLWRIRGRKGRTTPTQEETSSELTNGQFLLPTSARITLACTVDASWTKVGLRVSGFSIVNQVAKYTQPDTVSHDEDPSDMIIAEFDVTNDPANPANPLYLLAAPISASTALLDNAAVPASAMPEDLRDTPIGSIAPGTAVTQYAACTQAQLSANGVVTPPGNAVSGDAANANAYVDKYDPRLTSAGPQGPSIDGSKVHWHPHGPFQPTYNNTRYVQQGDVVEWTIETTTNGSDHPWHMHGFSFQPIRIDLKTNNMSDVSVGGEAGYKTLYEWDFVEYVDSIYVPFNHKLTFRFRVEDRDYIGEDDSETPGGVVGRWLAHCHITRHAHLGMMMNFFALNGCTIENFQHVDVYLRDNTSDTGEEPSTGSISASPDIILRPDTNNPVADWLTPPELNSNTLGSSVQKGQSNFIYARMLNRGTHPAKATTDIYWSEVSTLVTPNTWTNLGRTLETTVPGRNLVSGEPGVAVSPPLEWPDSAIPAPDHYCLIGVAGSEQDMRRISPEEVPTFDLNNDWSAFTALIKDNNSVTWRNFNVLPLAQLTGDAEKAADFMFRGAFDAERIFDLVINNPFENMVLQVPDVDHIREALQFVDAKVSEGRRTLDIQIPPRQEFRIPGLKLDRKRDYRSRFLVRDRFDEVIGKEFFAAQIYVDDFRDAIRAAKLKINDLADARQRAEKFGPVKNLDLAIEQTIKLQDALIEKSKERSKFERLEVGRVTWRFEKSHVAEKPEKPTVDREMTAFEHFIAMIRKILGLRVRP